VQEWTNVFSEIFQSVTDIKHLNCSTKCIESKAIPQEKKQSNYCANIFAKTYSEIVSVPNILLVMCGCVINIC
jgi:hypothetical protein